MVSLGVSFSQASLARPTKVEEGLRRGRSEIKMEGLRTLGGIGNLSTTVGGGGGGRLKADLSIVSPRASNEIRGGLCRSLMAPLIVPLIVPL